ncbi:hypothetical protein GF415_01455 [Candidatus Micrarchaeota archaeon]|nr:hypothetical protein [Candidatus Micrarchaeota archaeon]
MKWMLGILLAGLVFAGQIVNVGETTAGETSGSPSGDDSGCYQEYVQCLREGCETAGGDFNELNQGCYGGSDAVFSEAVGKCADAHGDCVMGAASQQESDSQESGSGTEGEEGLCSVGFVLIVLAGALFAGRR